MFLRQHRGLKAEENYRGASQRMCHIPPDLRYTDTKKTPLSKCHLTFQQHLWCLCHLYYLLHPVLLLSGTGWTEAGGEHFRHRRISKPGRPLQSSFSAPTQCWVLRKLYSAFCFSAHRKKKSVLLWAAFLCYARLGKCSDYILYTDLRFFCSVKGNTKWAKELKSGWDRRHWKRAEKAGVKLSGSRLVKAAVSNQKQSCFLSVHISSSCWPRPHQSDNFTFTTRRKFRMNGLTEMDNIQWICCLIE